MALKLPPADIYRAPFVEPIGHLAMQAALADQAVVNLLAAAPFSGSPLQAQIIEVDESVRNWDAKAKQYAEKRLSLIGDADLRQQATDIIARYERVKRGRNRIIHDAVEVGIDFDGEAYSLAVEYRKKSGVWTHKVTAEQIAAFACWVYEFNQDIRLIIEMVRDSVPADFVRA
jgi:hypothetical protein